MADAAQQPEILSTGAQKTDLSETLREDYSEDTDEEEISWEWIWSVGSPQPSGAAEGERKRRKIAKNSIVGAKLGNFECRIGDCVLLKADGSNEAWVAMICEFVEDDGDGEKAANFMWFSTEKEIRSKNKKRNDFYWVSISELALLKPEQAVLIRG